MPTPTDTLRAILASGHAAEEALASADLPGALAALSERRQHLDALTSAAPATGHEAAGLLAEVHRQSDRLRTGAAERLRSTEDALRQAGAVSRAHGRYQTGPASAHVLDTAPRGGISGAR
ncbi:MAG TPA: hypothetical protein EYQ24_10075 [Bacteroidetes bacterium]|nr:hypothetical protein [Bacteroidota bacterium]